MSISVVAEQLNRQSQNKNISWEYETKGDGGADKGVPTESRISGLASPRRCPHPPLFVNFSIMLLLYFRMLLCIDIIFSSTCHSPVLTSIDQYRFFKKIYRNVLYVYLSKCREQHECKNHLHKCKYDRYNKYVFITFLMCRV